MKKIRNLVLGGIQHKVFNLVLFTILLMVGAYTAVIINQLSGLKKLVAETNAQQKESISVISRETMEAVVNNSLAESTQMKAFIVNDLFEDVANAVKMLGTSASNILEEPGLYPRREYAPPDPALDGEVTMQVLTEEGVDPYEARLAVKLGRFANLKGMMTGIFKTVRINSCYIAFPEGVMLAVDSSSGSRVDENGDPITFPMRQRLWYTGARDKGGIYFSDVLTDVYTGEKSLTCSYPIYYAGKLAAVIAADIYLDSMTEAVEASEKNGSYVFIVNEEGHVVFSPRKEGIFQVKNAEESFDLRKSDNKELASFVKKAMRGETEVQLTTVDEADCYLCGYPVESPGWAVISVVSRAETDKPTEMLESQYDQIETSALTAYNTRLSYSRRTILVLVVLILVAGITAALRVSKKIVKPLETITKRVGSISEENPQFMMDKVYRTGDEIEVLAECFADMSAKTIQYVDQVKRITAEKERIGVELDMAEKIQASQLPRLFPAFPNRTEFDVYASMDPAKEVGGDFYDYFLTDEDHLCLVIADVAGKGVPAALFMMVSRVLLKTRLQNGETPGEALAHLNDQLLESNEAAMFVTIWLCVLEISTGKGVAANAGHEHPALRRAGGQYELVTYRHSPAVAVLEGMVFREHAFEMHPGDSLFVYTDGVPEATSEEDELFGTERMLSALNADPDAAPIQVLKNVKDGINTFMEDAEQFDDITMLCLKYFGPNSKMKKV